MKEPGPLLASGRDSDIFDYGNGVVLRRSREGHSMATEARTMAYARQFGYPVPRVHEVSDDGTDLVMDRIRGRSMVSELGRRPWAISRLGAVLAGLHAQLHEIPAPDWLGSAPCGEGDRLVHLDLHPLNVMLSPTGPVVIDWPNAARGEAAVDVALTWVLVASGAIPGGRLRAMAMGWGRNRLINAFLAPVDRDAVRALVPSVVAWKLRDPHMSAVERQAMQTFASHRP